MLPQIKIELSQEAQETLRAVQTLPQHILQGVAAAMDKQNEHTVAHAQQYYLSFPRQEPPVAIGLRAMTGRGRQSVRASAAVVVGDRVESAIGSGVPYMAVHEFGYEGEQTIPAHTRKVKSRNVYQIGERIPGKRERRTLAAQGVGFVKEFTRHVNFPARAPIQNSIANRLDDYSKAISDAVTQAWEGGGK